MKHRARIVAGTALALLMATAYATASPQPDAPMPGDAFQAAVPNVAATGVGVPVLLAQADEEELDAEELIRRQAEEEEATGQDDGQAQEPAAAEEPPAEESPAPAEEPTAAEPEAPAEAPPAAAEEPPAASEEAPTGAEQPTAAEPLPDEQPPVPEEAPPPPSPSDGAEPLPGDQPPVPEEAPQPPPSDGAEPLPGDQPPVPEEAPQPPPSDGAEPLPGDQPPVPEEAPQPPPSDGAEPLPGDQPPVPEEAPQPPPSDGAEPLPDQAEDPREAPLLDSEKEDPGEAEPQETGEPQPPVEEDPGPPPATDEEAQRFEEPVEIVPLRAEEGQRVERREERRERREGTNVLREIGDRIVIQLNNQVIVQSDDRGRIERGAEEVYYEELPRGRTRETVVRPNGIQVVTVYDRYGDVIRRSRIMPDGREHVLVYAGDRGFDGEERRQWRDPGRDLPPLRLRIPRDEYILDAGRVREPDAYYEFLNQPPVERVRRLYTVDEVRYSARVRDSVRRIDLDTITFDFGAASISESEVGRLASVAEAMQRLLEDNPAETFLIEGHTDAVGSDEANLALSDRRAEAVAMALTNVFDIPPENLVTQGYGERYLKIDTQEPERQNRRVAMRRITPLVAPVASAQ